MFITPLNVRGIGGSPEDVMDRYDPDSIPERVSKRAEEIAGKVNQLVNKVNDLESELASLRATVNRPPPRYR